MGVESCRASPAPPVGRPVYGTPYLGHGLRRPNFVPKFGASVKSSCPTADSSCCGAQNSLLACAHRILTAATPFCSLLPPLAALANIPLYTREPLGTGDADRRNQHPKFWNKSWLAVATPQARRPVGPPRNDNGFLSFRGAERRGNPSFLRWTGVRAAEVVGPYGKPNQPPKPAGAQRSVRARGREGWAGIGAKTIPKRGGPPRDCRGSA